MRYSILIILIIFLLTGFALAQETNHVEPYQGIPEKVQEKFNQMTEKIQSWFIKEKDELKEEIKEEIKEETKKQVQKKSRWAEETVKSWLSPLKIKIQEGSEVLKGWMRKGVGWVRGL